MNNWVHYDLKVILVSSPITLSHIIIMETYFVECVPKINCILSNIFIQDMYVFSLPIRLEMIVRIFVLYCIIIIKSEIWIINHCLYLDHDVLSAESPQKSSSNIWYHQMETFSTLLSFCTANSPLTGEFPSQRPVTQIFEVSLVCVCTNGGANNRDAGDLRRHRHHYDVTVMRNCQD